MRALLFVETGARPDLVRAAIDDYRNRDIELLVTIGVEAARVEAIRTLLFEKRILPNIFTPRDIGSQHIRWMRSAGEVMVESVDGHMSKEFCRWAGSIGARVVVMDASDDAAGMPADEHTAGAASRLPLLGGSEFVDFIEALREARQSQRVRVVEDA
jgi:hypothetical protein